MTDTHIPISPDSLARLRELARWAGVSLDEALDRVIKDQYDRRFWPAVEAGYAALRADPAEWAEVEAERKQFDGTLGDGLDPTERWNDDGSAAPPSDQRSAS